MDNGSWEEEEKEVEGVKSFHNGLGAEMVLWLRYLVFNVLRPEDSNLNINNLQPQILLSLLAANLIDLIDHLHLHSSLNNLTGLEILIPPHALSCPREWQLCVSANKYCLIFPGHSDY